MTSSCVVRGYTSFSRGEGLHVILTWSLGLHVILAWSLGLHAWNYRHVSTRSAWGPRGVRVMGLFLGFITTFRISSCAHSKDQPKNERGVEKTIICNKPLQAPLHASIVFTPPLGYTAYSHFTPVNLCSTFLFTVKKIEKR